MSEETPCKPVAQNVIYWRDKPITKMTKDELLISFSEFWAYHGRIVANRDAQIKVLNSVLDVKIAAASNKRLLKPKPTWRQWWTNRNTTSTQSTKRRS